MDWNLIWLILAYIFGIITIAIPTIFTDEIKRWRNRQEEKRKARQNFFQEINGWLIRYRTRWKGFLVIEAPDYKSFKDELKWLADQMTKTLSSGFRFLNEGNKRDVEQIANDIWKFGEFHIYMGCKDEFIKRGNEIDTKISDIIERLKKLRG